MKALRYLAVALIAAGAAWSIHAFCWRPLECNRLVQALNDPSYVLAEERSFRDIDQARRNLEQLQPCFAAPCRNVPLLFLAAVNYRTTGRNEVALSLYQEALRYDRRPEIYANIADTYAVLGNREAAYENYLTAAMFHVQWIRAIDDGELRVRVREAVLARYPEDESQIIGFERPQYN
jgi:tetratricopeptide (TPR) repeat protein